MVAASSTIPENISLNLVVEFDWYCKESELRVDPINIANPVDARIALAVVARIMVLIATRIDFLRLSFLGGAGDFGKIFRAAESLRPFAA